MKTIPFRLFAVLMLVFTVATTSHATTRVVGKSKVRESMIVSTKWLAKHIKDESLVLLHVGDKDEFVAGHIPRAQYIAISDFSTPRGQGLTLELPPVEQLKTTFEKFGVTDKSRIVIYFGKDWVSPSARVFMTLDYLGYEAHVYDGSFEDWSRRPDLPIVKSDAGNAEVKP